MRKILIFSLAAVALVGTPEFLAPLQAVEMNAQTYSSAEKRFVCSFWESMTEKLKNMNRNLSGASVKVKMEAFEAWINEGNLRILSSNCPADFRQAWQTYSSTLFRCIKIGEKMMRTGSLSAEERRLMQENDKASNALMEIYQRAKRN